MSDNGSPPAPAWRRPDAGSVATMLACPRCGARTRSGASCRAPAVKGKRRCRKHGGGAGSGAPVGNKNARKHGVHGAETKARRRAVMDYVRACNRAMKAWG